jgi:hypothetical protein
MNGYAPFLGQVRLVRVPYLGQVVRSVSGPDAARALALLTETIEKNPSCFAGEDLSVAYGLQSLFGKYGQATLNEDGARVLAAAEACAGMRPTEVMAPRGELVAPVPTAPPSQFPVAPVVGGLAAAGLLAYLAFG